MDKNDFKYAVNFQASSTSPIYEQLANFIRVQIKTNNFKPSEKITPENDICEVLNISRTTVRQAMEILVNEGLLIRYKRKGTFVADPKSRRTINNLYNFSENMKEIGVIPSSTVIQKEVLDAPEELSEILQLPSSYKKIFYLERIRCGNNEPILVEKTSIPYYLCQGIEEFDFSYNSLYQILQQNYGLNIYHATETIDAILINDSDAKLLHTNNKEIGYKIKRISNLSSGQICEYTTSITHASKCVFQLELYKKNQGKLINETNVSRNIFI